MSERGLAADVPDPATYRFPLGTPVWCFIGGEQWAPGTVIAHNYEEPTGVFNPYQIRLTDGHLVYAPADDDAGIRRATMQAECTHGHDAHSHRRVPCDDGHGHSHAHSHGNFDGGQTCMGHHHASEDVEAYELLSSPHAPGHGHSHSHGHTHNGQPCTGHGH